MKHAVLRAVFSFSAVREAPHDYARKENRARARARGRVNRQNLDFYKILTPSEILRVFMGGRFQTTTGR
jgi:hypothetical protein